MAEGLPVVARRTEIARAHKEAGGLVAAVFPIHYPRALLRAFGIHPMEVWGPPHVDATYGTAHLQPYVCSIVRNGLSFLQTGGLDVADILIVPHACDSLQGLGSLLIDFVHPRQPVIPIYLPRTVGSEARSFFIEEMHSVYRRLEAATCRSPSDADLLEAVQREEAADALLARLHADRLELPLDTFEFYRLIRAREFLPLEALCTLANAALALPRGDPPSGVPVVLSGLVPEPMELLQTFSKMGGRIAADDLACCGRRLYPPGTSDDPFLRMADSLLGGPPDPTRGSSVQARLDHLMRLAHTSGARGVVFYDVKFCEPELFYLPQLRRGLQEAGLPSAVIEVDLNDPVSHQTMTRMEAFLEMIA